MGPSRLPLLVSYQNQGDLGNFVSFKTFPRHIPPLTPSLPSTAQLIQVSTPAHGALSQSSASSYGASPRVRKLQYAMSRRHIGASPLDLSNGLAWSFAWTSRTALQLTHEIVLGLHQVVAFMVIWVMQGLRSCDPVALGPF